MTISFTSVIKICKILACLFGVFFYQDSLSKNIKYDQIKVSINTDSLKFIYLKREGYSSYIALLSLEKSLLYFNPDEMGLYIKDLSELSVKYPEEKSIYLYLLASYQYFLGDLNNCFRNASLSLKYSQVQKDTVGSISSLTLMGIVVGNSQEKVDEKKNYSIKYLKQAYLIGQNSKVTEGILLGNYAFVRLATLGNKPQNYNKLIQVAKESVLIIDNNYYYNFLYQKFYNALAITFDIKGNYTLSQYYNLKWLNYCNKYNLKKPISLIPNIAYIYLMEKDYEKALFFYKISLLNKDLRRSHNFRILRDIFNGLHKTLVALKKYKLASLYADSIYYYADKHMSFESTKKLNDLVITYETKNKEKEILNLKSKNDNSKILNRELIILTLILVTAFLAMLFLGVNLFKTNSLLKDTLNELNQTIKAREYFFSIIIHDIRKPIDSYQGLASVLSYCLKQKQFDRVDKIANTIDKSGLELKKLFDNLVGWILAQQNKLPYSPKVINLKFKINKIVYFFNQFYGDINIQVYCLVEKNIFVFADPNGIDLIIRNLLHNAIKAINNKGSINIVIKENINKKISIEIIDDGIGIDLDMVNIINEIFINPDISYPEKYNFGMGIILVSRFAKINNIVLNVSSIKDFETKFILYLTPIEI